MQWIILLAAIPLGVLIIGGVFALALVLNAMEKETMHEDEEMEEWQEWHKDEDSKDYCTQDGLQENYRE
ncbi:MAG: hypothetical protein ACRECH_15515 [Nitrososphaerales archaeon]